MVLHKVKSGNIVAILKYFVFTTILTCYFIFFREVSYSFTSVLKMDLKVLLGDFDMENSASVDIALSQIKCKEVRFSCLIFLC